MSAKTLTLAPNRSLKEQSSCVEKFNGDLRQLVCDMIETMYANDGIGLAAPQIGLAVQVFVASPKQKRGEELILVNPTLEAISGSVSFVEGCLSVPNKWARVKRAAYVRMTGQDIRGKPISVEANGLLAVVLQHEFDHLQGKLFIDRLPWFRRCRINLGLRRLS